MPTISHREMRNNSASVLRGVQDGETYVVTNDGVAVAAIVPSGEHVAELPVVRRATASRDIRLLARHGIRGDVRETLDQLRSER
ncbi:type II toxin-antitoxin system Phd/YefM family antitoxin [Microbacterium sp. bgisy207]|jgi:prevent-host-death family protein|uniref:type II toxin-antitoxin system Phd/YefM family antitoxin n=1 Tax=Microbacterium sp. bgisy207 TaxID=3413800 RepID=UPI003EB95C61